MKVTTGIGSFWGRFKYASLGIVILATLVACGGGGSAAPEAPQKTILSSVEIKAVTVSGVNVNGATIPPSEKLEVIYSAGGTQGSASVTTTCGGQSLAGTLEASSPTSLFFGHSDWAVGSCTGTVTVSAPGYASAAQTFSFTVKAPKTSLARIWANVRSDTLGWYPSIVTVFTDNTSSVVPAKNNTRWLAGGFSLSSCIVQRDVAAPVTSLKVACVEAGAGTWQAMVWTIATNQLDEYIGPSLPPVTDKTYWVDADAGTAVTLTTGKFYIKSGLKFDKTDGSTLTIDLTGGGSANAGAKAIGPL